MADDVMRRGETMHPEIAKLPPGDRPHLDEFEFRAIIEADLRGDPGYCYSQAEIDAGSVSLEDVKSVRQRRRERLRERGIEVPPASEPPRGATWVDAGPGAII
jgi:hypothetical protein